MNRALDKLPHNASAEHVFSQRGVQGTQNFPLELRVYSVHGISHEQVIEF